MTEKELIKYVLTRAPSLRLLLEKHENTSLFDYAQKEYHQYCTHPRKEEFIRLLTRYVAAKFPLEVAPLLEKTLQENYSISTADHHGPIGHPFWFQSGIIRGLVRPTEAIINLCTSHVSLGNSSYPRGFVMQSDTQKIPHLQLPLFPASSRMSPVFGHEPFTDISNHYLTQLKRHKNEGHISDEKYERIRSWAKLNLLDEKILQRKTYSEQITLINCQLWKDIFQDKLPPLITLDGEDIVSEILIDHLKKNNGLSPMLLEESMQPDIEHHFDGISCCFEREKLRGTYLFWYLDENHARHALWRKGNTLISEKGISVEMNAETLTTALVEKKLIPSGLLMYTALAGYYGLKCFGGYAQGSYLPAVLSAYSALSGEPLSSSDSTMCENIVFSLAERGSIATALDMLCVDGIDPTKLLFEAKNTTIRDSIYTMLPEIARCLPR